MQLGDAFFSLLETGLLQPIMLDAWSEANAVQFWMPYFISSPITKQASSCGLHNRK